jgi:hypothetical protein
MCIFFCVSHQPLSCFLAPMASSACSRRCRRSRYSWPCVYLHVDPLAASATLTMHVWSPQTRATLSTSSRSSSGTSPGAPTSEAVCATSSATTSLVPQLERNGTTMQVARTWHIHTCWPVAGPHVKLMLGLWPAAGTACVRRLTARACLRATTWPRTLSF